MFYIYSSKTDTGEMETQALTKLAYEAPETSVDVIVAEQDFVATTKGYSLSDMSFNSVYEDDDWED